MAGLLKNSPAHVIKQYIIDEALGSDPDADDENDRIPWPVFRGREVDRPDDLIKVSDTQGRDDGFSQVESEQQKHHGIQVMVRSTDYDEGYRKCLDIALLLDRANHASVSVEYVTEDDMGTGSPPAYIYEIAAVKTTTDVIPLGADTPQGKRLLFTFNAIAAIRLCAIVT